MASDVLDLIEPLPNDRYHVQCLDHTNARDCLDRVVDGQQHAVNLEAKHLREYHGDAKAAGVIKPTDHPTRLPDVELNLSAVAPLVTMAATMARMGSSSDTIGGVLAMWELLTGTSGEDAIELARSVGRAPQPVLAAVVPF